MYKSGQQVEKSGIYGIYDEFGHKINEATCVKDEPFPATIEKNCTFKAVHLTGHGEEITTKKPINNISFKSGEIVDKSGIYGIYNEFGNKINEATCVKDEPFPATSIKGCKFKPLHYAEHM